MYTISDNLKAALKSSNRKSSISGTLITRAGTMYELNDSNIIKDSLYITNQIVNDNKLTFGAVYAGECGLIINNSNINRYHLFGAEIRLNITLDGCEPLPLGVFYVDTPERIGSKIKITAIDCMSRLDVLIEESKNGTIYELLVWIAGRCNMELAQTQAEIEELHVNAISQTYIISAERIETYRDAVSFICMVLCANATIDRNGKLKLVQYATVACDTNDRNTRLSNCKFSDYTTRYSAITARFFEQENYYPYIQKNKEIDGLLLDLGDIPIVGGTSITKKLTLKTMLDTLQAIEYTPATLYISSNPAYELGDMLRCENVNNSNDSIDTYIMSYHYGYRQKETISCFGENPLLQNVKDKDKKLYDYLDSQLSGKEMVTVFATNEEELIVERIMRDLVTLNFSVNKNCRPIILCTFPFTIDVDGYVEFSLYNGLIPLENAVYTGYYLAGEHFATFMYLDTATQGERRSIVVMARCYADTTSAARTFDARLRVLENSDNTEVDTTEPTVIIPPFASKAIAYTQGINSGSGDWDGTLEFTDEIGIIPIASIDVETFWANVGTGMQIPTPASIAEMVANIQLSAIDVVGFMDELAFTEVIKDYVFDTNKAESYEYNADYVDTTNTYKLKTVHEYTLIEGNIDSGYMSVIEIDTAEYANVESVVITDG